MRKYELTYLISDEVLESDLNKITGKVGGYITDLGGKIAKEEIWGRRKLAYPIKKQDFATYVTLYFDLPGLAVKEFDREMRLTEKVLRHLLIVKEMGKEEMALTKEEIAAAAEIEEVVGGEKSFEAVVGETEESKDLMAKRESAQENTQPSSETETKENETAEEEVKETVKKSPKAKVEKTEKVSETTPEKVEETKEEEKVSSVEAAEDKPKAKKSPAKKKESDEADRLSKLNDELDDILKDEL